MFQSQQSASRKRIFEKYPKQQYRNTNNNPSSYKKQKNKQSLRAQDYLQRSLFLLTNIRNIQQKKNNYKGKQNLIQTFLAVSLEELDKLNKKSIPNQQQKLNQNLKKYYSSLRKSKQLLKQINCFSLANLINYDSMNTKMQLTRDQQTAKKDLNNIKNIIEQQRRSLQQALVFYQYSIQTSSILGETETFQYCLQQLGYTLRQQNIIKIHYLMMYQLQELNAILEKQKKIIIEAQYTYAKYQIIQDSLHLMQAHTQQIMQNKQFLLNRFINLSYQNASTILEKGPENIEVLSKNLKIYQSNMKNFIKYGTETNMESYQKKRQKYSFQLKDFEKVFAIWKDKQLKANHLYQQQNKLKIFKQKITMTNKSNLTTKQKDNILYAYYQCLRLEVPNSMPDIKSYKYDLCGKMEEQMKMNDIALTQRKNLFGKNDAESLRKYVQFFAALEYKQQTQKLNYLLQRKQTIEVFQYQLQQQIQNDSNYQTQKFAVGFRYALNIVKCQLKISVLEKQGQLLELNQFVKQFQVLQRQRWRGLPIGLENVVFYYLNDLSLQRESRRYLKDYITELKSYQEKILNHLQKIVENKIYNQLTQSPYFCMEINFAIHEGIYLNVIRNISPQNQLLSNSIEASYWKQIELTIKSAYRKHFKEFKDSVFLSVDKKEFFSFKILCYLLLSGKNLKVPNIDQICLYYIDHIDRSYMQWNANRLYLQIVKAGLFKQYLSKILSKHIQTKTYTQMCENIIFAMRRMLQSQVYLQNTHQNINGIFYGLKLHQSLLEMKSTFTSTQKVQIQDQTLNLMKSLRKPIFIIGTKKKLNQFMQIFSYKEQIPNFEKSLTKYKSNESSKQIFFLGEIYVLMSNLFKILRLIENDFESYENISIKEKNNTIYYLRKIKEEIQETISPTNRYLLIINDIFKNQGRQIIQKELIQTPLTEIMNLVCQKLNKI